MSQPRWLGAAALSTTAAIHIALVPSHLREAPYAGVAFIALAAGSLLVAMWLIAAADRLAWWAAAGLAASALVAYAVSRSVGLPSMSDDIGDWLNSLGVAAGAAELAAVLCAAWVLTGPVQPRRISSTGAVSSTGPSPSR